MPPYDECSEVLRRLEHIQCAQSKTAEGLARLETRVDALTDKISEYRTISEDRGVRLASLEASYHMHLGVRAALLAIGSVLGAVITWVMSYRSDK